VSWDPYLDLDSGVLHNRLGITDRDQLARAEAALTAARIYELQQRPLPGGYDLTHLKTFHRVIFGDVYTWAGELRTVALGKGAAFCPPHDLVRVGEAIFAGVARVHYLRGLQEPEFVDGLAELLAAINSLHPFREGNGRAQRAFVSQLAREAGYRVRWARMDRDTNVAASAAAHRGDTVPLRRMLSRLVEPVRSDDRPPRRAGE
jgi:cell filamentation protein